MKDTNFYQQINEVKKSLNKIDKKEIYLRVKYQLYLAEKYLEMEDIANSLEWFYSSEACLEQLKYSEAEQNQPWGALMAEVTNYGFLIHNRGGKWINDAERIYQFVKKCLNLWENDFYIEKACVCYNLGIIYMSRDQLEEAYSEFKYVAELFRKVYNTLGLDESLKIRIYFNSFNLALCCEKLLKYAEAEKNYRLAIAIQYIFANRDDKDFILTILRLEDLYLHLSQTNKAEQLLVDIISIIDDLSDLSNDIYYYIYICRCDIEYRKANYEKMLEMIHNCYQWMEKFPILPNLLYEFLCMEYAGYRELGQIEECSKVIDRILILFESESDQIIANRKTIYKMQAEILDEQGHNEEAIQKFELSMQEYEKEKKRDVFWEISFWESFTVTYINGFRYREAKETANHCINLIESLSVNQQEYNQMYLSTCINMGLIYMREMRPDKAERYFFMALNLCEQRKAQNTGINDEVNVLILLAWMYIGMWQHERAAYYIDIAEKLILESKSKASRKMCMNIYQIRSLVSMCQKNVEEGLKWIDKAIEFEKDQISIDSCRNLCLRGLILQEKGSPSAIECYQKSLELASKLKLENTEFYLEIFLDWLTSIPIIRNEEIVALKEIVEKSTLPDSYYKIAPYIFIVKNSLSLGRWLDAFEYSIKAILLYEKLIRDAIQYKNLVHIVNYKQNIKLFYNVFFSYLLRINEEGGKILEYFPVLFHLFRYYKLGDFYLLKQMNQNHQGYSEQSYHQIESELNYLNYMSNILYAQTNMEHELLMKKADIEYWEKETERDDKEKNITSVEKYKDFLCIDYYCPDSRWSAKVSVSFAVVWRYSAPKEKILVNLASADCIQISVTRFREAVLQDASTQNQEKELYQLLIAPIAEKFPGLQHVHDFIICPDGIIATIPFEAILGIGNRILYVPFMETLNTEEAFSSRLAMVAGNPVITRHNPFGMELLQRSEDECSRVADELQAAGYTVRILCGSGEEKNDGFFKETFLHYLNTEHPAIIHLSTHGFYTEGKKLHCLNDKTMITDNPYKKCGIIMNDNVENGKYEFNRSVIWGEDILKLDMTGTRLTVLSTCVSGLGSIASGEWLTGLQRAFFIAGVENIIVSLWEVDEEATEVLMDYFYQYMQKGQPWDLALLKAKRDLISYRGGIYSTPFYWAGFIYIGKICI